MSNTLLKKDGFILYEYPQFIGTQDYFKDEIDGENCPLKSIKTHDRELVKEVCEKIKEFENSKSNSIADENGWFNSIRKGMTLNEFLDQIEKEYEK